VRVDSSAGETATDRVAIRVEGLSKVFETARGEVTALRSTDLTIDSGEFVCVVGPSGCGKTTLLNILADLDQASSGTIAFQVPSADRPLQSVVFQEQGVFPWLTILDNAAYGLAMRGVGKSKRRAVASAVLKRMGLGQFEASYPDELSGGMRQRVNIARAFATDPHILLMDEPFGSLDEQTKLLLQDDLLGIWEESRRTVVFITHSIDEAIRLADRIVVMSARPGRIKASLPVTLPRPRHVLDMSEDAEYIRLRNEVWELLREEVLATREMEQQRTAGGSR